MSRDHVLTGQVPLDPEAGRPLDDRRGRGQHPGLRARARHQGPLRVHRERRLPRVGAARPDDGRRRAPRAGLRPARRHQDLAGERVPAPSRSAAWCSTATSSTTSPRTSRSRSAPACWSTASTSPTTRCWSAARSRTPTPSATGSGPNYLQLPVNQRQDAGGHQPARRADGYHVDHGRAEPARELRAVDHRRAARGAVPARTTSRAR